MNQKISLIQYNAVSLPSEVRFGDGSYITYLYDASGRKLRADYHINQMGTLNPIIGPLPMSVGAGTADEDEASIASIPIIGPNPPIIPIRLTHTFTEYCGNHIFENGLLTMTLIPGGYITYEGGSISAPSYHFYICDHEGNNRVVTSMSGAIEQVNDYTPFGVLMKNDFTATSTQRYKYNGKELDRMHGLDLYDYGARLYDAPLGRWHVMDPLCEKYYSWSPYVYCANNPLSNIDEGGKKIIFINGLLAFGAKPGSRYWGMTFIIGAKEHFNDANVYFTTIKHGLFSGSKQRFRKGYQWAQEHFEELTQDLSQGENFHLISHSMGGAFSKGVEKYLEENDYSVDENLMISAFQAGSIPNEDDETLNIDIKIKNDIVLKIGFCYKSKLENADISRTIDTDESSMRFIHTSYSNDGFWPKIENVIYEYFHNTDDKSKK